MKTEKVLFMCWTVILLPVLYGQAGENHVSLLFVLLMRAEVKNYLLWAPVYAFFVWALGCGIIHIATLLIKTLRG